MKTKAVLRATAAALAFTLAVNATSGLAQTLRAPGSDIRAQAIEDLTDARR